ncbi:hypothetical protein, partial [Ellagibacter isourolithinifaciens]|uniref:hypothetical protein n=1 Tax=Ellagibacter isourolithinifaciens TaxID=2137581 RepID=UPI003AAF9365
ALPAELIPRKRCIDYINRTAISVKRFFEKVFNRLAEAARVDSQPQPHTRLSFSHSAARSGRNATSERKMSPMPR